MSAPTRDAAPAEVVHPTGRILRTRNGGLSLRIDSRVLVVCLLILAAALAVCVVSIGTGDFPLSPAEVLRTLTGHGSKATEFVVITLRLPRMLTGLLVGAALGVGGAVFQSLSRNPLGSPDIVGFTTGAATGAVIALLVFHAGAAVVAVAAIVGGLVTALLVYLFAWKRGVQGYRLVLIGIGVSAMLASVNSYLLTRADVRDAQAAAVWLTGSLNGRGWEHVLPVAAALLVLLPILLLFGRRLRLLEMGDDTATALGVPAERSRLILIVVAVAITAVATASAGPIGFVALAAPQVARRLVRAPGVGLVSSALMGAFLLVASDLAAQRLLAPTQLPVGVMTGAVGGVYLAWLLAREWRSRIT
ncbi:FecCD family ABC transporter permease [Actinopolymorpha pittospori]|uniref:Iron complex transport system permease protein n=1 Tax=Actinopolymorpha pittospori TaxID=648752 RepID=A0A927MS20_9ACTN|nr:iron complex transport system permease protein [Actinopolymorpha pittospori]